jgi:hypothetical protein
MHLLLYFTVFFTTIPQASCEKLVAGLLSTELLRLKSTNLCLKYIRPIIIITCTLLPAESLASRRTMMLSTWQLVRQPVQSTCLRQADDPAFQAIYLFVVYLIIALVSQTRGH